MKRDWGEMGVSSFLFSNSGEGWTTVTFFSRERERGKGSRRGWDAALVPEPLNCAEGGGLWLSLTYPGVCGLVGGGSGIWGLGFLGRGMVDQGEDCGNGLGDGGAVEDY